MGLCSFWPLPGWGFCKRGRCTGPSVTFLLPRCKRKVTKRKKRPLRRPPPCGRSGGAKERAPPVRLRWPLLGPMSFFKRARLMGLCSFSPLPGPGWGFASGGACRPFVLFGRRSRPGWVFKRARLMGSSSRGVPAPLDNPPAGAGRPRPRCRGHPGPRTKGIGVQEWFLLQ